MNNILCHDYMTYPEIWLKIRQLPEIINFQEKFFNFFFQFLQWQCHLRAVVLAYKHGKTGFSMKMAHEWMLKLRPMQSGSYGRRGRNFDPAEQFAKFFFRIIIEIFLNTFPRRDDFKRIFAPEAIQIEFKSEMGEAVAIFPAMV